MRITGGQGKRLALTTGPALAASPAWAQQGAPSGWMMHGPGDGWSWMMMMGPLVMILVLAALIALVVFLVRWLSDGSSGRSDGRQPGSGGQGDKKTSVDILKDRYARGEIDQKEFEERKRVLEQ